MKKRPLPILAPVLLLLALSCSGEKTIRIIVDNPLDFERKGELTELAIDTALVNFATGTYILKEETGREIPYQLSTSDGAPVLLFQADAHPLSTSTYFLVKGRPSAVRPLTNARFVAERKDDFSWENDFAAYRMYGPALAGENPSNGVDIWMKSTDTLVADKFYADELQRHISYHENNGQGLDCYDVKHTAGAGGIAPYTDRIHIGDHYDRYEITEAGPLRSTFTLFYDSVLINGAIYQASIRITAEAGSMLNKASVTYLGPEKGFTRLAAGIVLHADHNPAVVRPDIISNTEKAVSASGIPQGSCHIGVYMPEAITTLTEDGHQLILAEYTPGQTLTYYFGGSWSQWRYPDFSSWNEALIRFTCTRELPLKASIQ
ncbi:MAG: DUF4861 domain-containing protein [Tannerellaceae bacterium]|jgi:hypothetical protein|nr:DUF4861 domain-containing protein [Tannerellaceae bacterium]